MFFERTPIHDVAHTSLLAFAETGITGAIHDMVRSGVIVRVRTCQPCLCTPFEG